MDTASLVRKPLEAQEADLAALAGRGRLRKLVAPEGVDFSSNDYLGLAASERLRAAAAAALERGVAIGSGGSRLLRGNHAEHEALEAQAAQVFGCEAALYLANGYTANSALFSTLPQRGDCIFFDELIHASAHEGIRLSRADAQAFAHNDMDGLRDALAAWRSRNGAATAWIAVESLYSMDGDRAPLPELAAIAGRYDAVLLIDEAHATGVFGPAGQGLAHDLDGLANVITLRTLGKAMGCEGALLCGPATMRDHIVNRGRGFVFSTAPSPLMAAVAREALTMLADEPHRREALAVLVARAHGVLTRHGAMPSGSQIMPLVLGDEARTMHVAAAIQRAGFDVRGIRPPTVPTGSSRLRISITLNVMPDDIDRLGETIAQVLA